MSVAATTSREVTASLVAAGGRSKDRNNSSLVFLGLLWFSLFFGVMVLVVLILDTAIAGAGRFDGDLLFSYDSIVRPESTGFRAGILGSLWLMIFTALMAVPLGIAAALYLEEFAKKETWYNRLIEVNLQNLAAVPSIVYGLLAVAVMALLGFQQTGIVLGGALALALLILPVIIITTREAVRAVPQDSARPRSRWERPRGRPPGVRPCRRPCRASRQARSWASPGPSARRHRSSSWASPGRFASTPPACSARSPLCRCRSSRSPRSRKQSSREAASAAIIVLLVMILGLNGLAIFIRNKFARTW